MQFQPVERSSESVVYKPRLMLIRVTSFPSLSTSPLDLGPCADDSNKSHDLHLQGIKFLAEAHFVQDPCVLWQWTSRDNEHQRMRPKDSRFLPHVTLSVISTANSLLFRPLLRLVVRVDFFLFPFIRFVFIRTDTLWENRSLGCSFPLNCTIYWGRMKD